MTIKELHDLAWMFQSDPEMPYWDRHTEFDGLYCYDCLEKRVGSEDPEAFDVAYRQALYDAGVITRAENETRIDGGWAWETDTVAYCEDCNCLLAHSFCGDIDGELDCWLDEESPIEWTPDTAYHVANLLEGSDYAGCEHLRPKYDALVSLCEVAIAAKEAP